MLVKDEKKCPHHPRDFFAAWGRFGLVFTSSLGGGPASHGAEGVALYAKHADDIKLVISDMNMPIMYGAALIKDVQAIQPNVKILTTSGLSPNVDLGLRADQAGASGFLIKPYSAEQPLLKINELLKT